MRLQFLFSGVILVGLFDVAHSITFGAEDDRVCSDDETVTRQWCESCCRDWCEEDDICIDDRCWSLFSAWDTLTKEVETSTSTKEARKYALLVDDVQEEYRHILEPRIGNIVKLVDWFRKESQPIVWGTWSRRSPDDGYFGSLDRWWAGLVLKELATGLLLKKENGEDLMPEAAPQSVEEKKMVLHSKYYDMFRAGEEDGGESRLHKYLQEQGVNTVVLVGAWTDECIVSTAFRAFNWDYDVIVVQDATYSGWGYEAHVAALDLMKKSCCRVTDSDGLLKILMEPNTATS
jgi:nicotinamidase-related amidase